MSTRGWPTRDPDDHPVSELASDRVGPLSPFGDVTFPGARLDPAVPAPGHRRQPIAVTNGPSGGTTALSGNRARLSHLDDHGAARMVDVTAKTATHRSATACGTVHTTAEVVAMIASGGLPKGMPWPPLGWPAFWLPSAPATSSRCVISLPQRGRRPIPCIGAADVGITASVRTTGRTGVEMEALTAVTVAGLTVYDMIKAVDPAARLDDVHVMRKEGGKNGVWTARP